MSSHFISVQHLKPEEPYACVLNTVTRRSSTMSMKGSEASIIDGVAVLGTSVQGPLHRVSETSHFLRVSLPVVCWLASQNERSMDRYTNSAQTQVMTFMENSE